MVNDGLTAENVAALEIIQSGADAIAEFVNNWAWQTDLGMSYYFEGRACEALNPLVIEPLDSRLVVAMLTNSEVTEYAKSPLEVALGLFAARVLYHFDTIYPPARRLSQLPIVNDSMAQEVLLDGRPGIIVAPDCQTELGNSDEEADNLAELLPTMLYIARSVITRPDMHLFRPEDDQQHVPLAQSVLDKIMRLKMFMSYTSADRLARRGNLTPQDIKQNTPLLLEIADDLTHADADEQELYRKVLLGAKS